MNTAQDYIDLVDASPLIERTTEQAEALRLAYESLHPVEQRVVDRVLKERYFILENLRGEEEEHVSPSGRYRLVVTSYATKPGSWNYTRGEVYRVADGQRISDVKRNYDRFLFCWVEDHPMGDFFICGGDYQGQTVIDLRTGRRRDELSPGAEKGHGFCWVDVKPSPDKTLLLVNGCIWACPYMYQVYDFSNPMNLGWPEVEMPEDGPCLYASEDTTIEVVEDQIVYIKSQRMFLATGEEADDISSRLSHLLHEQRKAEKLGDPGVIAAAMAAVDAHAVAYPDEDEDADRWGTVPEHRVVFRREGPALLVVEEWKSERVLEGERRRAEYSARWAEESRRFMAEDPFYQWFVARVGDAKTARSQTSFSLPSLNMRDEGDTNPAYFRVTMHPYQEGHRRSVFLEWGVVCGEIKLDLWMRGTGSTSSTYPRSLDGFVAAWAAGEAYLGA